MSDKTYLRNLIHNILVGGVTYGVCATVSMPVYAQDEPDQTGQSEELMIEEIYVTARKRQELAIEIPMNITVVGEAEIEARNLVTKEDLFRTIAGAASPRGQLILRGLAGSNDSAPDTTTTFTDGIPFDFSNLYDVQRVEVLRGPQGTLWGSNAIGGTVQVITNKPSTTELQVGAQTIFNSEKDRPGIGTIASAYLNMPLIDDTLGLRVTGSAYNRDGKILNSFTGTTGKENGHFIRAQLLWTPNEDTNINLSLYNTRDFTSTHLAVDVSQPLYYYDAILTANPEADYGYDVYFEFPDCPPTGGRTECLGGQLNGHNPDFAIYQLMDPFEEWTTDLVSLNVEKFDIFSGADLFYVGSYRTTHYDGLQAVWTRYDANDLFRTWIIDKDTDFAAGSNGNRWTHELRLQSNGDGAFQWTVGAFYDDFDAHTTPDAQWQYHASDDKSRAIAAYLWGYYWGYDALFPDQGGDPSKIGQDLYGDDTKNYNWAIYDWDRTETAFFGEADYNFEFNNGHNLELTAGIRFYDLQDLVNDSNTGIWIGPEPIEIHTDDGESGNRLKFSFNYMPNDNLSIFGIYSEGYRRGGNNGATAPQDCRNDTAIGSYVDRYESDTIENYEIGFKGFAFNRRMRFSSAIYHIDWTGVQAPVYMESCGFSYTANAAAAQSRGIEFESQSLLTDNLTLTFNAAYTKSEMTADSEPLDAKKGDDMTMVPKYNYYLALDQDIQMWGRDGNLRVDLSGYGETNSYFNPKPTDIAPAYKVVGIAGSVMVVDNVRVGLYVNNLLDEEVILYARSRSRSEAGWVPLDVLYGDARNVSVRVDFNF